MCTLTKNRTNTSNAFHNVEQPSTHKTPEMEWCPKRDSFKTSLYRSCSSVRQHLRGSGMECSAHAFHVPHCLRMTEKFTNCASIKTYVWLDITSSLSGVRVAHRHFGYIVRSLQHPAHTHTHISIHIHNPNKNQGQCFKRFSTLYVDSTC